MTFRELQYLWRSDLYRYTGGTSTKSYLRYLFLSVGFRFTFWLRLAGYLRNARPAAVMKPLHFLSRLVLRHYGYKFGFQIGDRIQLGSGFLIYHFGGIVLNERVIIGKNCDIAHDVTIGMGGRGNASGTPIIGDNVFLGPGCKVFGPIRIGHNVAIGANAVVTKDVPDNAVVAGIPAKIISYNGASDFIRNTDFEAKFPQPTNGQVKRTLTPVG